MNFIKVNLALGFLLLASCAEKANEKTSSNGKISQKPNK